MEKLSGGNNMKLIRLFSVIFVFAITSSAFSQWVSVGSVTNAGTFPSISVYGQDGVVIAGGPAGTPKVFKSTNGGTSFTDISGNLPAGKELFCVWAVDANTIYVGDGGASGGAGGDAKVYKTTDGGTTWVQIMNTGGPAGFFNSIVFSKSTPSVGVIQSDPPLGVGTPYYVRRTTDGGTTWTTVTCPGVTGQASSQNGLVVIDANFYGFGLGNALPARVVITTDGGTTWNTRQSAITGTNGFVGGFCFSDDKQRGLMGLSTSLPNLGRTTDGGVTWSTVNIGAGVTGYANLKWISGTDIVYVAGAVGAGGVIKRSTDGGVTWTLMTTSGVANITHMEYFKVGSQIFLYAVSSAGSVIKYADLVGIDPENTTVPSEFALQQNYPNPFNPSTTVKFSVPVSGSVSLKIYNSLGTEVMAVLDKNLMQGNYVENIDMNGFSSGTYFYTLSGAGFKDTKKMILVK